MTMKTKLSLFDLVIDELMELKKLGMISGRTANVIRDKINNSEKLREEIKHSGMKRSEIVDFLIESH